MINHNTITILQNSTAIPFKWHRQFYLCFYCHKPFSTFNEVKQHTSEHKTVNIKSAVTFLCANDKVKIDITSFKCKLCDHELLNIDSCIDHLKLRHGKPFEDADIGVIPYKHELDSFDCGICNEKFHYFVKLNQHMNSHYGNHVCETCGKSFLSAARRRLHSLIHASDVQCEHCPEKFRSLSMKNYHVNKLHQSNVKCGFCSEQFASYKQRKVHLKLIHNVGSLHACPVCSREFHCKSRMEYHLKGVHYKEKHFGCSMCDQRFFSNWQLTKHVKIHEMGRGSQCELCCKTFSKASSLKEHLRTCVSRKT